MKLKRYARLGGLLAAAVAAFAMMASAAQAETPAPGYEQFAGCPSKKENPIITSCINNVVTSGSFKMGSKTVPIEHPITLSGGTDEFLGHFSFTSKGGMPPVKQKVPGGVIGLTGLTWLLEFLGSEALTLYAATELAGQVVFEGTEHITLPIKVHLINGTLGNNCYVGSTSNPITLHLTTATSGSLTGEEGTARFEPSTEILHVEHSKYVDGTFSAPGASGCVLTLFGFIPISINGLVNSQSGLPAASGNETTQIINTEIVEEPLVYP